MGSLSLLKARAPLVGFFFGALLIGFGCLHVWHSDQALDYYQYWAAGRALKEVPARTIYSLEGQADVRRYFNDLPSDKKGRMQLLSEKNWSQYFFSATPFFYLVFKLTSTDDFDSNYRTFEWIKVILFVTGVFLLCHVLEYPAWAAFALCAGLMLFFPPFRLDIAATNTNPIQIGLLGFFLFYSRRFSGRVHDTVAGLLLGVIVAFKPNLLYVPIVLLMFFLVSRRHKKLLATGEGIVIAAALIVFCTYMTMGERCGWIEWWKHLKENMIHIPWQRTFFSAWPWNVTYILILLAAMLPLSYLTIDRENDSAKNRFSELDFLVIGLGTSVYLLSGPFLFRSYFLLTVPLLLWVFRPGRLVTPPLQNSLTYIGIALLFVLPFRFFDFFDSTRQHWLMHGGTLILFGLGVFDLYGATRRAKTA